MVDSMTYFMQIYRARAQRFVDGKHTLTPAEQASDDWMGDAGCDRYGYFVGAEPAGRVHGGNGSDDQRTRPVKRADRIRATPTQKMA
jgi:hypothetical protein